MQPDFTIIVPFYKETTALAFASYYFGTLGIEPIFALDSKQIARRGEAEDIIGRPVAIYDNPGGFVESNFKQLAALSPTDWILRVDCDEVPNLKMLDHCARFVRRPTSNLCGYLRDDLLWRRDHFDKLKFSALYFDTQFRLFDRTRVRFKHEIHTPGYHVPKWKLPLVPLWAAPPRARLYHLARTFVAPAQRAARMEDRQDYQQGVGVAFREWNLRPDETHQWEHFDDPAFTRLFSDWWKKHGDH